MLNKAFKDQDSKIGNLPTLERLANAKFKEEAASVDYSSYVTSGDLHYVVGRLLFELRIWEYALFCSQQAIENYLKAYIKLQGHEPPFTHSLKDLLDESRKNINGSPFINSNYLEIIVQRFDPFNEVARYPVHKTRPSGNSWVSVYPDDMYILDYFIYKMREIIQLPANHSDLFLTGHHQLAYFESLHPDFYRKVTANNINFNSRN